MRGGGSAELNDPYRHHPELRGQITPVEESRFREFTLEWVLNLFEEHGRDPGKFFDNDTREALRRDMLSRSPPGDLWVFAYGSLMWDPAFHFTEVRRARVDGFERRFIMIEDMARGTEDKPGVMAALDAGTACNGLIFRIAEDMVDQETEILCRRELIAPAYLAQFHPVETEHGIETALMFVADPASDIIEPDLPHEKQVEYLATGCGVFGTSAEYLRNIVAKFHALGIEDVETEALLSDVEARIAALK